MNSAGPGDTVCVGPGDYAPFTNNSDGTASQRLRIRSTVKHGAHIQGSGSGSGINNLGKYVDIEGFEISNVFDGIVNGDGRHANHVTISHNYVHDTSAMGIISVNWTSAAKYQGFDVEIFNNVVENTGVGRGDGRGHNIYVSHPQSKIYNNVTLGTPGWGIHLWHNGVDSEIYNNYVSNSYGIVAGTGNDPCSTITCDTGGYSVHDNVLAKAYRAIDLRGTRDNSTNGNAFFDTPGSKTSGYGSNPIYLSSAPDPFADDRG